MRTETALKTGLPCPTCGRTLVPITVERSVTLHCGNGHELPLKDLISPPSFAILDGVEKLLETWNQELRRLAAALEDAQSHGCMDVALMYHRQMKGIVARSEVLRTALASTFSATGVSGVAEASPVPPPRRWGEAEERGSGLRTSIGL
jgi:hypothetical protein